MPVGVEGTSAYAAGVVVVPAASPAAIREDVACQAGLDGMIHADGPANDAEFWSYDVGALPSGGLGIAEGVVVVGAATPQLAPFTLPGTTIRAFGLGVGSATPEATPMG